LQTFVSEEAPLLGNLPIKATVIHLTKGASDNWAAVFTKNRVGFVLQINAFPAELLKSSIAYYFLKVPWSACDCRSKASC
jgi:hypothetical protein